MQRETSFQPQRPDDVQKALFVWANPGKVIDRNGRPVDVSGEKWLLQDPIDNMNVNWDLIDTASDIKSAMKAYVAYTIESKAPKTACQSFRQLGYCFARLPAISSAWDLQYEVMEGLLNRLRAERKDWHFHHLRKWYQWCDDQGISGFSGEVASRLYRLKIQMNPHGDKVMTRDVNDGPLTNDEHFLVRQAVKERRGLLVKRVIVMMFLELGARPMQLALLEEQDFQCHVSPTGHEFYSLNVPRIKQRTVGELEKKNRRISSDLANQIRELIVENHRKHGDQGPQMPILCATNITHKKLPRELKARYSLHIKVIALNYRVQSYVRELNIISPRTNKVINLHPRRLRYTFFTLLAEQGVATRHLAELADHSDTKSIWIYIGSSSNVVDRLNKALGKDRHYTETLNRFLGKITERIEKEDSTAVISGSAPTLKNLGGIGVCGADYLCRLFPPLSCYICPKFQAWIDGPHKQMLNELETYVQQLIDQSGMPGDRIPYQLIEVITAIQQLISRIEEIHNGEK